MAAYATFHNFLTPFASYPLLQIIGYLLKGGGFTLLVDGKAHIALGYHVRIDMMDISKYPAIMNQNLLTIWLAINHHGDGVVLIPSLVIYNMKLNNPSVFGLEELLLLHLAILPPRCHGLEYGKGCQHSQNYQ